MIGPCRVKHVDAVESVICWDILDTISIGPFPVAESSPARSSLYLTKLFEEHILLEALRSHMTTQRQQGDPVGVVQSEHQNARSTNVPIFPINLS